ncbi:T6SS immunity protein Tli3 family protein [Burkholderia sp. LMG 21824]|uniref:T6SS immunity protein Tli3 family protein n=1 Tax=Burkholderia sp. LMG 21824 TaxID=3158172 RepID=UPI003C2D5EB7
MRFSLAALALLFFFAACANTAQPVAGASSKADFHEYEVYRIDDSRYITIRSKHPCIGGQMDGQIFYYDARQNVRTMVSFTGGMNNGLYRGYYAIQSTPNFIAIPSFAFSERRGMLLRINYSHDGGRTFKWFLAGYDDRPDYSIIQKGNYLYLTVFDQKSSSNYSDRPGAVLDIDQDMDPETSHYDNTSVPIEIYGKTVVRHQIPLSMKSPSGATHWTCPTTSKD